MSSRCAVVRVLEVGITGLTVLEGGGLGPVEEEEKGLKTGEGLRWVEVGGGGRVGGTGFTQYFY